MTVLPPGGCAVQRAMLWTSAAGMWSGSMGWFGKIQSVYSAPGSLGVLLSLIQSMAAKTTSGCGPLRSTQSRPRDGTEAEDAAGDGEVAVVVGDDFVGDGEEVECGFGEGFVAGLRIAPEGLRRGEVLREEGAEARVENELVLAAFGGRGAVLPEPLDVFLWLLLVFFDLRRRGLGRRWLGVGICACVAVAAKCRMRRRRRVGGAARHWSSSSVASVRLMLRWQ